MDAQTAAVAITGLTVVGKPAIDLVKDVIGRIVTPSADAIGQGLAAPVQQWAKRRQENALSTVIDAATILIEKGVKPSAVPGRVLIPILEKSSVEDDLGLHQVWARLLATAADPVSADTVLPSFAHILSELSPIEVHILDFVLTHGAEASGYHAFDLPQVSGHFDINHSTILVYRDNLERLNLISPPVGSLSDEALVSGVPYKGALYLTSLGYAFIRACTMEKQHSHSGNAGAF
jgi:hypothetical protein